MSAGAAPTITAAQAVAMGVDHHRAGNLPQARALYEAVLRSELVGAVVLFLLSLLGTDRKSHV